jgi:hypothetical protein
MSRRRTRPVVASRSTRVSPYDAPVLLEGTNGERLELTLVGYEFPDEADDEWDANWLVVRISAADAPDAWTAEEACLLTWEVDELAGWLDAAADAPAAVDDLEFTEPNLVLERVEEGGTGIVRVWFENAFRPPGVPEDEDVLIDFALAPPALRAAAGSLRDQLRRFPRRGGPD